MYSADQIKDNVYIEESLNSLENDEILILKKSLPHNITLGALKGKNAIRLVIHNKNKKKRVAAYKLTLNNKEDFYYRISDSMFMNLKNLDKMNNFKYPKPATARLSSSFKPARTNPVSGKIRPHNGIDYSMPMNTKVVSVIDGKVSKSGWNKSMGYYVEIFGKDRIKTRYLHLNRILVKSGQDVIKGQKIALSGNSGMSSGPHLHYELIFKGEPVNSLDFKLSKMSTKKTSPHIYTHIEKYGKYLE
ncbi:M23 family metallopeptidase [Salmonella enterica subsp. enterica serovar Havana]|uniref:Peptidase M23 n=1 Tax=Salmonella enterica TaxID=28901 RepID=A0A723DQI3_SALER|nr:peptidoglycan DD-metalloendopeptidase family protein [Salmonella enterica subsp. enterica serovar Havana]HAD9412119.1 peptidase M23 [Salmonella enterica]HAZ2978952.1 peptidoglycan DD-metalloendopeptidase family protein [Salmonella enterica subsp. enterica serovar Havana]